MVGRELLTMCPDGEDHQGHDWGEKETVYQAYTSRGMMLRGLKRLTLLMRQISYAHQNRGMATVMMSVGYFNLMNFYSMVWRLIKNKQNPGVWVDIILMIRKWKMMHITMIIEIIL